VADFAFNNRIAYHVILSCGCAYWEHRPIGQVPPEIGRAELCHADAHSGITATPLHANSSDFLTLCNKP
jgi:hypothetical protein